MYMYVFSVLVQHVWQVCVHLRIDYISHKTHRVVLLCTGVCTRLIGRQPTCACKFVSVVWQTLAGPGLIFTGAVKRVDEICTLDISRVQISSTRLNNIY